MRQLLCIHELAPGKEGHVIRCHTAVCCPSPAVQTMQGTPRQELYSLPVDIPSKNPVHHVPDESFPIEERFGGFLVI